MDRTDRTIALAMATIKNENRDGGLYYPRCVTVALLLILSVGAGTVCAILLAANHWLIDRPIGWLNPVRWVLTAAWIFGWGFGGTHSQNRAASLVGAAFASSTLIFLFLFLVAEAIRALLTFRRKS